jgi:hypothetical protein
MFVIIINKYIRENNITNWDGNLIKSEDGDIAFKINVSDPAHYSSADESSSGKNFKNYASFIDKFENEYFDVILVDGRSRPSCIMHSIPKLKKGGYLILDNSDRSYYTVELKDTLKVNFTVIIDKYGASPYVDFFTKSTIWKKK